MVWLKLTSAGRAAAERLAVARSDKFARVLDAIPEGKRAGVLESLNVLVEALRDHP